MARTIRALVRTVYARRSADAVVPLRPSHRRPRLTPPESLSDAERALFLDLVAACAPDHFSPSDLVLLCRYVEAAVLGEEAARRLREDGAVINGRPSAWITVQEKAVRALTALSLRLRLSPQGRALRNVKSREAPSIYERLDVELDDDEDD